MKSFTLRLLLLYVVFLYATNSLHARVTIDSIRSTPSRCANDGTIKIYAHSTSPMVYAIVSGPGRRSAQSSDTFGGMAAGSYRVLVKNYANDSVTGSIVVGGTYQFPDFTPSYRNTSCIGSATGVIVGNSDTAMGLPPFSWQITNMATGVVRTQVSDSFFNVPAGNYWIREYDSCQSYATYQVRVNDPPVTPFYISSITNKFLNCFDLRVDIGLNVPNLNSHADAYPYPYYTRIKRGNSYFYDTMEVGMNYLTYYSYPAPAVHLPGRTWIGDVLTIWVSDACGHLDSINDTIKNPLDLFLTFSSQASGSCSALPSAIFGFKSTSYQNGLGGHCNITTKAPPPFLLTVKDSAGRIVERDSISGNSIFTGGLPGDQRYTITVVDQCGDTFTKTYIWPTIPSVPMTIGNSDACLDSTVTKIWDTHNSSLATLTIWAGPATIHSSKAGIAYIDTVQYPVVRRGIAKIIVANMGVGTYHYTIIDSCGLNRTDSVVITPQDVMDFKSPRYTYHNGCPGTNEIAIVLPQNAATSIVYTAYMSLDLISGNGPTRVIQVISSFAPPRIATLTNVVYGKYAVDIKYNYRSIPYIGIDTNQGCSVGQDTIDAPPYLTPSIAYDIQAKCTGNINVVLQPDTTKGVPPYNYEIISGPQTLPLQHNNVFPLTLKGTYVARISDTCGFAQTFTFRLDTVAFGEVLKIGSSCGGGSAMLVCQPAYFAYHRWQRPNGAFYIGDTLNINPVLTSDYGIYHVAKIVDVNGCRDTFYSTYSLDSIATSFTYADICPGQSYTFGARTLTVPGTYYDTLRTSLCDSVAVLYLVYHGVARYQENVTICANQSVTVGSHTYNMAGTYLDTFATSGCDSIHILNLTVKPVYADTIRRVLCHGDSTVFYGSTYRSSGMYSDTFSSVAGCDSVKVLDLTISPALYDTINRDICIGDSFYFGGRYILVSGSYHDTLQNAAGCDSFLTVNLNFTTMIHSAIAEIVCMGHSTVFNGQSISSAGVYIDTVVSVGGCDSITALTVSIAPYLRGSLAKSICEGQRFFFHGMSIDTAGVFLDTVATTGCDSITTLTLTVIPTQRVAVSQTICEGHPINYNGLIISAAGVYIDTLQAATGCDSIVTLTISVTLTVRSAQTRDLCEGSSFVFGSNTITTAGTYIRTIAAASGCDSIITLTVVGHALSHDTLRETICAGRTFFFHHGNISNAGFYRDTASNVAGCDSFTYLRLSVLPRPVSQFIIQPAGMVQMGSEITVTNQTQNADTVLWLLNDQFINMVAGNTLPMNDTGTYCIRLIATTGGGCSDTSMQCIFVYNNLFYLPNAFTPNSDGTNDYLELYGTKQNIRYLGIKIFDRWGEKVFDSNDIDFKWDGKYRGELMEPNIYTYVLDLSFISGYTVHNKGSISLIR